jgi:ribonucleoside-diphosphate reductase alpha subunit
MKVQKRDGSVCDMMFDEISAGVVDLCRERGIGHVDPAFVAQKVCASLYDMITTAEIDVLSSEIAASLITKHPDYGRLAAAIVVRNMHKTIPNDPIEAFRLQHEAGTLSDATWAAVSQHQEKIREGVDLGRDYLFDYFALKTLEKSYLGRVHGSIVELPQTLWMRVSLGIWPQDFDRALVTYELLSKKYFTHATPTLFNAGTKHPQLSSCFLTGIKADSIDGIYDTLKDCARISKWAGGIGLHIHDVRCRNSPIKGTNGFSSGVMPMLKVLNATARYVNQCFTPDTVVYVPGGVKEIATICPGRDRVLARDGKYHLVLQSIKTFVEKDIVSIRVDGSTDAVQCTPEHELYVYEPRSKKPGFKPASRLIPGDMLGFPIPTEVVDDAPDRELWTYYAYGLLVSEAGSLNENGVASIRLNDRTDIVAWLLRRGVLYWARGDEVHWYVKDLHRSDLFDDVTGEKRVHPRFMALSEEKTLEIVKGLLHGSGSYTGDAIYYHAPSKSVAYGLRRLLMRLGILCGGYVRESGERVLRIPRHRALRSVYPDLAVDHNLPYTMREGMMWTEVVDLSTKRYSGHVYDLNVEDDHTYTTDTGLVHNSGKRNGSVAVYVEPWHPDILEVLDAKKNHGDEEARARDLFYAMWIPDLFMRRVKEDGTWSLFCPNKCPGLSDVYGETFDELYQRYEREGRQETTMSAQKLWFSILTSQIETGTPYMLYKDACNAKSNQKNLGTIKSSNLCTEIVEFTSPDEIAVCNLASICLSRFVDRTAFDFGELHRVAKIVTRNLDQVIDQTFYPVSEAKHSNLRNRPVGIGVQGLADVFMELGLPFESQEARQLNRDIFETLYHGAMEASADLAEELGPYETFAGSPASQGTFQFDLWGVDPGNERHDWAALKERVKKTGLRNSLLLAPMPTATTSQIMGNNEAFEPYTSNIYLRRTLAGEFVVVNRHLIRELLELGLWNDELKNKIIASHGSVQDIPEIPVALKAVYKTAWEIKQKALIDMAADRGAFVCQSQSLNLFVSSATFAKLSSMHFYAWEKGLKTGMYYLRTQAAANPVKFTLEPKACETCSS